MTIMRESTNEETLNALMGNAHNILQNSPELALSVEQQLREWGIPSHWIQETLTQIQNFDQSSNSEDVAPAELDETDWSALLTSPHVPAMLSGFISTSGSTAGPLAPVPEAEGANGPEAEGANGPDAEGTNGPEAETEIDWSSILEDIMRFTGGGADVGGGSGAGSEVGNNNQRIISMGLQIGDGSGELSGILRSFMTGLGGNAADPPDNFEDPVPVPLAMTDLNKNTELSYVPRGHQDAKTICVVCQDPIGEKTIQRILSCNHHYHYGCIDTWFETSCLCPFCRHDLREDQEESISDLSEGDDFSDALTDESST